MNSERQSFFFKTRNYRQRANSLPFVFIVRSKYLVVILGIVLMILRESNPVVYWASSLLDCVVRRVIPSWEGVVVNGFRAPTKRIFCGRGCLLFAEPEKFVFSGHVLYPQKNRFLHGKEPALQRQICRIAFKI